VTSVDSLGPRERAALADVIAMCEELVARARGLVAAGARPIDAVSEVFLTSDPKAIAGVAIVSVLGALDANPAERSFPGALTN